MYRNCDGWGPFIGTSFHPSFDPGFGGFGHALDGFGHGFGNFHLSFCLKLGDQS